MEGRTALKCSGSLGRPFRVLALCRLNVLFGTFRRLVRWLVAAVLRLLI